MKPFGHCVLLTKDNGSVTFFTYIAKLSIVVNLRCFICGGSKKIRFRYWLGHVIVFLRLIYAHILIILLKNKFNNNIVCNTTIQFVVCK